MPQQPIPTQEAFVDLEFPDFGIDISNPFGDQRPQTTRQGVNVRTYEAQTQRGRGGSRPGISQFIPEQLPAGPHLVQHLNFVVDPSADALLDEYDFEDGIVDPSNLGRGRGRRIRRGGSGRRPSKNRKKTPLINWADPADITVGTALDGTQLNATAVDPVTLGSVSGSFAYNPPSGTVLPAGTGKPLKTTFTPTDDINYRTAKATVHINVTDSGIQFVQSAQAREVGFSTVTFDASVTINNDILVYVVSSVATGDPTVTDAQANSYTKVGSLVASDGYQLSLWYARASATGANTVTFTTDNQDNTWAVALEYKNVKASGPVDDSANNAVSSPGDSWTTTNLTVGVAGDLLLGAFFGNNIAAFATDHLTGAAGFTKRLAAIGLPADEADPDLRTLGSFWLFEKINPSTGSQAVTATLDAGFEPTVYLAHGAAFKKA